MRRLNADGWVALVLLVACGAFLVELDGSEASGAYVKTTTLPIALTLALGLLALVLLGLSLLRRAEPSLQESDAAGEDTPARRFAPAARAIGLVVLTAIYIAALPWFGYIAATAVYIAVLALLFGSRSPVAVLGLAIAVPLVLLVFFEKYMVVLLPSARLFQ